MVDKTFVNSLVGKAFDQVQGLSDDIAFSNSQSSSFDFSSLEAVTTEPIVATYTGLVGDVTRDVTTRSFRVDVLFKSDDLPSADQYDSATFRGRDWKVIDYYSDGYTTTVSFGGS